MSDGDVRASSGFASVSGDSPITSMSAQNDGFKSTEGALTRKERRSSRVTEAADEFLRREVRDRSRSDANAMNAATYAMEEAEGFRILSNLNREARHQGLPEPYDLDAIVEREVNEILDLSEDSSNCINEMVQEEANSDACSDKTRKSDSDPFPRGSIASSTMNPDEYIHSDHSKLLWKHHAVIHDRGLDAEGVGSQAQTEGLMANRMAQGESAPNNDHSTGKGFVSRIISAMASVFGGTQRIMSTILSSIGAFFERRDLPPPPPSL